MPANPTSRPFLLCLAILLLAATWAAAQLQSFKHCTLVPTDWADGDSFQVRLPDGKLQTMRLYGVDCIEMHVQGDDSNARRLRDQRRYFGIEDILVAKSIGEQARDETRRVLLEPFTVHTNFANGRGDDRYQRVYAFVFTADGKNLSEWLVARGLARAFGVVRQLPDDTKGTEWSEQLKDLELTAAKAGLGAWAHTDWKKLPESRKQAREEMSEIKVARGEGTAGENQPVPLNTADRAALMALPGVGEKTADRIIAARPFRHVEDLSKVQGVGPAAMKKLRPLVCLDAAQVK